MTYLKYQQRIKPNRLIEFENYSVAEIEKYVSENYFRRHDIINYAVLLRKLKLDTEFSFDMNFFDKFELLNERLTQLMNELYDKMILIKNLLAHSMNDKPNAFTGFELEGKVYYEDSETEKIEILELLSNMDGSAYWSIMINNDFGNNKSIALLNDSNWDIEMFDLEEIKNRKIWVCYLMHSLFIDGAYSFPDLMSLKPECFSLSIEACFDL